MESWGSGLELGLGSTDSGGGSVSGLANLLFMECLGLRIHGFELEGFGLFGLIVAESSG